MSKFHWYSAFDKMNVSVYIVDLETFEVLYINDRLRERIGDIIGMPCYQGLVGADAPCLQCTPKAELIAKGGLSIAKQRFNKLMNAYYDVYENIVEWDNGRLARLCVAVDVTEQTLQTNKAKELQSMVFVHDAINKSSDIFFFAIDENLNVLYTNKLYLSETGIDAKVGQRLPLEQLYAPKEVIRFLTEVFPAVMSGEPMGGKVLLNGKEGRKIPLKFSAFPVINEDGKVIAYASFGVNVSREVEMEKITEWQKAILNNTRDMLASFDKNLHVVYCNPSLNRVTGWMDHPETAYARGEFLTPESRERVFRDIIPKVFAGESCSEEVNVISQTGELIPNLLELFPINDLENNNIGIGLTMHDISVQHKFIAANERLQMALDLANAGTWEIFVPEKMLYYDERFSKMMHLPKGPITISQWADHIESLFGVGEYSELIDYLRNRFDGTWPNDYRTMRMDFADGSIMYSNCTATIFYDDNGKPERILGVTWDVTQEALEHIKFEKLKERQLRSQEFISNLSVPFTQPTDLSVLMDNALEMMEEYFKTDRMCIYIMDETRSKIRCAYQKMGDAPCDDLLGKEFHISDLGMLEQKLAEQPYVYFPNTEDLFKRLPSISYGARSILCVPLITNGITIGYMVFVTVNREANWDENDLQLVQLATSVIAGAISKKESENKLKEATLQAQSASIAKSRFLSNMSHEIRTPMNAIQGMAQLAESTDSVEVLKSYMENIRTASNQLLSIINDILEISKIESGKIDLNNAVFDLERTILRSCAMISQRLSGKNLRLKITGGDQLKLRYIGDDTRVYQIITNLLSNAMKFSPDGGDIVLTADEIGERDGRAVIQIVVRDNGIGMSEEQKARVFSPFEQADGSIARRFGGTGLGLAITKTIVEMMDGSIDVQSELGKGSAFVVQICLDYAQEHYKICSEIKTRFSPLKVLLFADNEALVSKFSKQCERFGICCELTGDCKSVKQRLMEAADGNAPFDAVFFDASAESAQDESVRRCIADLTDSYRLIPIIEYNAWERMREALKAYGCTSYLEKPIMTPQFHDLFAGVLYDVKHEQKGKKTDGQDFSGMCMLLAEDVQINREILKAMLEQTHIAIDEAENGQAAVDMFRRNPEKYDLIIMDVQMPGINGLEATRAIRALDCAKAATIPIIAMTAHAFKEDVDECLASGMNDHIAKPVDADIVISMIKKVRNRNGIGL